MKNTLNMIISLTLVLPIFLSFTGGGGDMGGGGGGEGTTGDGK